MGQKQPKHLNTIRKEEEEEGKNFSGGRGRCGERECPFLWGSRRGDTSLPALRARGRRKKHLSSGGDQARRRHEGEDSGSGSGWLCPLACEEKCSRRRGSFEGHQHPSRVLSLSIEE